MSQRITFSLYIVGRNVIIPFLVVVLFCHAASGALLALRLSFASLKFDPNGVVEAFDRRPSRGLHMVVQHCVHFVLCDTLSTHSRQALEIDRSLDSRVKQYYSNN
jgi:hypothetical protein